MSGPFIRRLTGEFVSLQSTSLAVSAADLLALDSIGFWLETAPQAFARELLIKLKRAAKLVVRATPVRHCHSLEAIAKTYGFASWYELLQHLQRAPAEFEASESWVMRLAYASALLARTPRHVRVPPELLGAHEQSAAKLAANVGASPHEMLDKVLAPLCGELTWGAVRGRTPFQASDALYGFNCDGDLNGASFEQSAACDDLIEELDDHVQWDIDHPEDGGRALRAWLEKALEFQPGFLEGGLNLAWLQHEAGEAGASATLDRFIAQAEALVPSGFDGRMVWGHQTNRTYHRMLWLRLKILHENDRLRPAIATARRLLNLNPNDNLGVRYLLPLLHLQAGHHASALRACKYFRAELDHLPAALRAFCLFATGDEVGFRRELARALFTLPELRLCLQSQPAELAPGEDGYRGLQPDLETFVLFAWPACRGVPGLIEACEDFLDEPQVRHAESELLRAWRGRALLNAHGPSTLDFWQALMNKWIGRLAGPDRSCVE